MENNTSVNRTSLCKCGQPAQFIKDYFVSESKTLKEGSGEAAVKRNVDSACGILRRRYCPSCLSKIAMRQRKLNARLNAKIIFAVFLPLFVFTALEALSHFVLESPSAFGKMLVGGILTVAVSAGLAIFLGIAQMKRKRIAGADYSNLKAIDALLDSLNFGYDDFKVIEAIPSADVLVDGDGRVNYETERSGFAMRVLYKGRITLEPMRRRILYPFNGDAEYIKKTYTNADLLKDNIKVTDDRELTEADFDIKNGKLHRYSGLAVNVAVPENVTAIAPQAFKNSKNCETIILPSGITELGKETFAFCPATSVNIPSGVKKIPSFCFYSSAIREIIIPDTVEEIEDNAFGFCQGLEAIVIPPSCKRIGEAAFKGCEALVSLELNEGLESLADYCFNGCKSLEALDVPDGCFELGNFAFEGCVALKEVYLPETIQFVGGRVFEGARSLSIVGKEGSYAEKFATEYRLRFVAQTGPRYKKHHRARRI